MSVQIRRRGKLELPAASKSKVNSGFDTGQLLSGSLVPHRASNATLHCTETGQQRHGEGGLRASGQVPITDLAHKNALAAGNLQLDKRHSLQRCRISLSPSFAERRIDLAMDCTCAELTGSGNDATAASKAIFMMLMASGGKDAFEKSFIFQNKPFISRQSQGNSSRTPPRSIRSSRAVRPRRCGGNRVGATGIASRNLSPISAQIAPLWTRLI